MEELRYALRRLAKAVVVITAAENGRRYAMAATAVSELSFDPPSMLVCVNQTASLYPVLKAGAPFAINILSREQQHIAQQCTGVIKGEDRFSVGEWTTDALGVPVLGGAQAVIVCRNAKRVDYGTHGIYIGDVESVSTNDPADPLIYVDMRYTNAMAAD